MSKILFTFPVIFLLVGKIFPYPLITETEIALGTYVEIKIEKKPESKKIIEEAFKKIKEFENKMSIFNPESEISLVNKNKKWKISDDTKQVILKAIEISKLTDGAFDITCKPLLDLYREAKKKNRPPSETEIKKVLKYVGWKKLKIDGNILILKKGMEIDLGGIAKGFIVDKIAEFLKKKGIKNGLINAGGDIYCFGLNPEGKYWKIGIRNPKERSKIIEVINLSGKGVATSGNYERYIKIKKEKFGHIVNPKTGKSTYNIPLSVTVIAPDCATADGLATGCFVLGVKKGLELLNRIKNVEGIIIDENMKIYRTKNFSLFTSP